MIRCARILTDSILLNMEDADLARNEKVLEQEKGISELNDDDAFFEKLGEQV